MQILLDDLAASTNFEDEQNILLLYDTIRIYENFNK